MGLPKYRCHKVVEAAKIKGFDHGGGRAAAAGGVTIVLELPDGSELPVMVTHDFMKKHEPQAGGYFVLYEDAYQSYSPAQAFERGYALIEDDPLAASQSQQTLVGM